MKDYDRIAERLFEFEEGTNLFHFQNKVHVIPDFIGNKGLRHELAAHHAWWFTHFQ